MTITAALARCTERGCAWRWRDGDDRPCAEHADNDRNAVLDAAIALGIDLAAMPGDRDGDHDGDSDGTVP